MLRFDFAVMGTPVGKGRPRAFAFHGHARMFTPKKTTTYESIVRGAFVQEYGEQPPLSVPLSVAIVCYFPYPKSAYWPVNRNHNGELRDEWKGKPYTGKPDLDNVAKAILDGLNTVAFEDDSQIVGLQISKFYGERPRAEIQISDLR